MAPSLGRADRQWPRLHAVASLGHFPCGRAACAGALWKWSPIGVSGKAEVRPSADSPVSPTPPLPSPHPSPHPQGGPSPPSASKAMFQSRPSRLHELTIRRPSVRGTVHPRLRGTQQSVYGRRPTGSPDRPGPWQLPKCGRVISCREAGGREIKAGRVYFSHAPHPLVLAPSHPAREVTRPPPSLPAPMGHVSHVTARASGSSPPCDVFSGGTNNLWPIHWPPHG